MRYSALFALLATACGSPAEPPAPDAGDAHDAGTDAGPAQCRPPDLAIGDANGHPDPLGASAGQARAGRLDGARVPQHPTGLGVWDEGGFVLANDRVAMLIEDAGPSQLYDPWGGRPLAIGRMQDGRVVDVANFGEILLLQGRYTVMTTSVTVMNDGSDGSPAIVRAVGPMRRLPFFEYITAPLLVTEYDDVDAAIDYVLAPDTSTIEIRMSFASRHASTLRSVIAMHAFMYTPRMPQFAAGPGFDASNADRVPYLAFTDEQGVSYAYSIPDHDLGKGIEEAGFVSRFGATLGIRGCALTETVHAHVTIGGGRGVDALLSTMASEAGEAQREIAGVVRDASGAPASGVRVHAMTAAGEYLTRSLPTGADGRYAIHVPESQTVQLYAFRLGDALVGPIDGTTSTVDLALAAGGYVHARVTDPDGAPLPARIQVMPGDGAIVPMVPVQFGETLPTGGRVQIALAETGEATLRVPAGSWHVIASRGYEYELAQTDVTIAEGATVEVASMLERVVETPGLLCGDFHIHTSRSNDSDDDGFYKVQAAAADGLELPIRSDHEFVNSFEREVEALGVGPWVNGSIGSVEMSSMEIWGHMGIVPLVPDRTQSNGGTPLWQEWPTPSDPTRPLRLMSPKEVFDIARARPERPTVIINHPLGSTNYFGYCGLDPSTGLVGSPSDWDDEFTAVEFFNDASWQGERGRTVRYWLGFLDHGRRVFAVGSSDSHHIVSSPVGYPRTCLELGTDVPGEATPDGVRDALAQGHSVISGGIYVDARIGEVGPGGDASAGGPTANVHVRVQSASWIDASAIEIIVDGATLTTIPISEADADPLQPTVRFDRDVEIPVAETGSYVIVAATGGGTLEPLHPGRQPFGVANPIFVSR